MADNRKVIALCSVGNLGKYLCDELLAGGLYDFVSKANKGVFFEQRNIDVRASDYSVESVLDILNDTNASALISFNNADGETFVNVHCSLLEACRRSNNCKRFIPSEFAGNIDDYPLHPSYFTASRVPFRKILERETDIEWTIFNNGWLMEYFLTKDKSHMPAIPDEFPVDPNGWKACIRGSGDQEQSFTSARDVAKALIMLLGAPEWERTIYITGQWSTFNKMVKFMEEFHGRPMTKTFRSEEDIYRDSMLPPTADNAETVYVASVEEMMISGSGACPREKTIRQRSKYFNNLQFTTLEELLLNRDPQGPQTATRLCTLF
ncbi:hypothetical protein HIM_05246 [Hirsutella minnesotensis 3608]|uniref:Uncharacterized protein n=1 Tax=Hirsutella minnesotensis 3608 TaxID=1043627 RepID=A0A0F7ZPD7_9HYPO|nr:hypothetical protein HIM_05246 [Hirsutella minnesotensis 3608]